MKEEHLQKLREHGNAIAAGGGGAEAAAPKEEQKANANDDYDDGTGNR